MNGKALELVKAASTTGWKLPSIVWNTIDRRHSGNTRILSKSAYSNYIVFNMDWNKLGENFR